MTLFTFRDHADYFANRLSISIPDPFIESEGLELTLDHLNVTLKPTRQFGGLLTSIRLGLLLHPIPEQHLHELMTSNYLSVNTGGCTLALDEAGVIVFLESKTTPFTPPQENWEWLHRTINCAYEWVKIMTLWDEFVPLIRVEGEVR